MFLSLLKHKILFRLDKKSWRTRQKVVKVLEKYNSAFSLDTNRRNYRLN